MDVGKATSGWAASFPASLSVNHSYLAALSLSLSFFCPLRLSASKMATVSATSLNFRPLTTSPPLGRMDQISRQAASVRMIGAACTKNITFPSLRTSRFQVSCMAKPDTVQKVCDIVRKQLALPAETELTPDSTFASLGADSLDTVEIVMGLEEEFGINVEDENSENITTIEDAADLIEKLVQLNSSHRI
nr:acyl carrier protein 1, chloroplastic-like isoform X2 [Coffea arabica]